MNDKPGQPVNAQQFVPWIALVIASIALAVALVALFERGGRAAEPEPPFRSMPSAAPAPGAPPDLSTMTPRQAADRLFNRVMSASESGDTAEAQRFAPMALQAYGNLGTLDNDARYHVALLHLTTGDTAGARAQIDQLRKSVPGHLMAFMLEHQIAQRSGNKDGAARAYRSFLAAYGTEIVAGRAEYADHANTLERFRQAALAGTTGRK